MGTFAQTHDIVFDLSPQGQNFLKHIPALSGCLGRAV
jgi:hypothetical protein